MKRIIRSIAGLALAAIMAQTGWSIELVSKDDATLNMHGRLQTFGFTNYVEDPFRDHLRLYLFVKQARLAFNGHVNDIKYDVELAFGGEEGLQTTSGGTANASQGLLDFNMDVPLFGTAYLKTGQFKVPYGLERLTNSGSLLFAERSIMTAPFNAGRDVGVALYDNADRYAYTLGIFTGAGRDNPIRDIPLTLGAPLITARAGIKNRIDDDLFDPKQVSLEPMKPGFAVFANALYIKDSRVGHSTVLQVKPVEKSLLTNSNWNPFITQKDVTGGSNYLLGDLWQAGGDAVYRVNAGPGLLSVEGEANYGLYKNSAGNVQATGARIQFGYHQSPWSVALRYAIVFPDDKSGNGTVKIFKNRDPIHEVTPSITMFHKKNLKIIFDAPIQVDVPVSVENKLGYYVLTDQPDQSGVGTVIRQVVPSGRMLLQLVF